MSFQAGEILVANLVVAIGETPVISCCKCIAWIVAHSRKIFEDLAPDPVATEECQLIYQNIAEVDVLT